MAYPFMRVITPQPVAGLFFFKATLDGDKFYKYIHNSASTAVAFTEVLLSKSRAALILLPVINHAGLMKRLTSLPG
ncbi:TPA: hypothetical protein MIT43_25995 [Klebsiella pneumoniae]|nr:hypothetical protein [Klebsiella pneumoniae]